MLGWGIGIFSHYIRVFGMPGIGVLDQDWEEREIQKELKSGQRSNNGEYEELELKDIDYQRNRNYRDDELV